MVDSILIGDRKLMVTGDRILVSPPTAGERTDSGLYVPESAVDKKKVLAGWVEAAGPGYPIPEPVDSSREPWETSDAPAMRHYPLQVEKGDYVLYVKSASWEVRVDSNRYYVVPFSAVLVVMRTPLEMED